MELASLASFRPFQLFGRQEWPVRQRTIILVLLTVAIFPESSAFVSFRGVPIIRNSRPPLATSQPFALRRSTKLTRAIPLTRANCLANDAHGHEDVHVDGVSMGNITTSSDFTDADLEKMLAAGKLTDIDEKLMTTELKEIKDQMIATLRRRRKLIRKLGALSSTDVTNQFKGKIKTYCTAEEYNMTHAVRRLRVWSGGKASFVDDGRVLHVQPKPNDADTGTRDGEGNVFVFPYGVVVCWGLSDEQDAELLTVLKFCEKQSYGDPETDDFTYSYGDSYSFVQSQDELVLATRPDGTFESAERNVLEKLAASHGFAQSSKLSSFAESVQRSIEATRGLAAELASQGDVTSMSQRDVTRNLGSLVLDRHAIYLYADVLDVPDVCWENPELDPLYRLVERYLELKPRVDLLNRRVEVVRELLSLLSEELNNKHASQLEEIIIWLITVEIVLELVKEIVPFVTAWVKKQAATQAGHAIGAQGVVAATTTALTAPSVVAITLLTFVGICIAGAIFTGMYWWWTVLRPHWARRFAGGGGGRHGTTTLHHYH